MKQEVFNAMPEKDRWNRVLEGEMYYASVHKPNTSGVTQFNALPEYTVSLVLDKENLEKAKSYGLRIREANEYIPGPHVKITRKIKENQKAEDLKPEVVDSMQKAIPSTILIGNKSRGMVKFGTYWHPNNGGGVSTLLSKVQVLGLVPYTPPTTDRDLAQDPEGWTTPTGDIAGGEEFDA